jgi:hypothetical protein
VLSLGFQVYFFYFGTCFAAKIHDCPLPSRSNQIGFTCC